MPPQNIEDPFFSGEPDSREEEHRRELLALMRRGSQTTVFQSAHVEGECAYCSDVFEDEDAEALVIMMPDTGLICGQCFLNNDHLCAACGQALRGSAGTFFLHEIGDYFVHHICANVLYTFIER